MVAKRVQIVLCILIAALTVTETYQGEFWLQRQLQFKPQDAIQIRSDSAAQKFQPIKQDLSKLQASNLKNVGRILDQAQYQRSISNSALIENLPQNSQTNDYRQSFEEQFGESQARGASFMSSLNANSGERCQRNRLSKVLQGAKNLLTGGFSTLERSASAGNLMMLGSSLLAAAVPLAVLVLPDYTRGRRRTGGSESAGSVSDSSSNGTLELGLHGRIDSLMGWIERSVEHLPNFPRLHPQECVKRSICEAHNDPNKYGAIGFILRLLFPATNLSSTDRMDNMEYKVINKYRHAAGFGLTKRSDNNGTSSGACKEKYEDCLVSLLDVAQSLMDIFLK